ncbi:MAG TPA: Do family serine endopeptidase, partial [Candidatus Marinimicrobia bacterium]|nr:Do family serine endopeptidase [Candidatus Neomarinimicrobiota bacterium]
SLWRIVPEIIITEEFFGDDYFRNNSPQRERRSRALGSGVIVDAKEGYILTNNHVVEDADEIAIFLIDEREFKAEVVGTDPKSDLAVLKIDAGNLTSIRLGDSDKLDVGEWVLAIGSPFSTNLSHTVTAGIVSAKGRSRVIGSVDYQDFIQTDAAINPGNSGGALVNLEGELVGINTAIATGGLMRSNVGVGFAIPTNLAKTIMNDLIVEGRVIRSWLGVFIQDVNDGIAKALDLPDRKGAVVTEVVEGSPADKAGFKVEDVVVAFGGKKVRDSSHLKNLVSSTRPETKQDVGIIRRGRSRTLKVDLVELPQEDVILASNRTPSFSLGMRVEDLDASMARRFRLEDSESGVVVVEVSPSSAAAEAGVQPGDIIKRIGDTEIDSAREFRTAISRVNDEDSILLLIRRRGGSIFLPIELN